MILDGHWQCVCVCACVWCIIMILVVWITACFFVLTCPPLQVSILAWKLIPRKWKETCWKTIPKLKSKKQLHCFTQNETIIFKNQTITIKEQRFFAIFWAKRYIFDPSISWPMDSFCASGMSLVMILPVWSVTSRHPVLSVDTLKLGSVSASSASSQPSLFFATCFCLWTFSATGGVGWPELPAPKPLASPRLRPCHHLRPNRVRPGRQTIHVTNMVYTWMHDIQMYLF